jgi:hypothetical protein
LGGTSAEALRKQGKLDQERKDRLDSLGFVWDSETQDEASWNEYFKQICAFRQRKGNCRVPRLLDGNQSLYKWALSQRNLCKEDKLNHVRKNRLDSLGFEWETLLSRRRTLTQTEALWNERFEELRAIHQRQGARALPSSKGGTNSV